MKKPTQDYLFIDKTVFFPETGILAVGDLHVGYEHMLKQSGMNIPETQTKDIINNFKGIFAKINQETYKIKKIIFLGDIKHFFGYEKKEKLALKEIYDFLRQSFSEQDIIFIKGNHDKFGYFGKKLKNYYVKNETMFLHGNLKYEKIYDKQIHTIVMAHLHPSIILSDKKGVKKEKFKCFLVGNYEKKQFIVLPSFLEITDGVAVNDYKEDYGRYASIIPKEALMKFQVFVIGKDEIFDFGRLDKI